MARFFNRFAKKGRHSSERRPSSSKKEDLMDPILYQGGLDPDKYPALPLDKERKPVEEPENPLNKR